MNRASPSDSSKLTADEFALVHKVLVASEDEEDRELAGAFGRRTLTDDERERVRRLLAREMLRYELLPDGSLPSEGRAIDAVIGKLMFY